MRNNTKVALAISLGFLVGSIGLAQASSDDRYERSDRSSTERSSSDRDRSGSSDRSSSDRDRSGNTVRSSSDRDRSGSSDRNRSNDRDSSRGGRS